LGLFFYAFFFIEDNPLFIIVDYYALLLELFQRQ